MSRINLLNINVEREKAVGALRANNGRVASIDACLVEYIACLDDALRDCQGPPPKALNLENRLDLAAQWAQSIKITAPRPDEHGWRAEVRSDRIGDKKLITASFADSPADALSLALADAAAWVKAQKDIK